MKRGLILGNCSINDIEDVIPSLRAIPHILEVNTLDGNPYEFSCEVQAPDQSSFHSSLYEIRNLELVTSTSTMISIKDATRDKTPLSEYNNGLIMINCELGREDEIIEKLGEMDNIIFIEAIYGIYDLFAKIEASDYQKMTEFSQKIGRMDHIAKSFLIPIKKS